LVAGQKVSTFNAGTDEYNVRVRAVGQFRANAEGLKRMLVASEKLGWVSLENLVHVEEGTGPSSIDRYNRQRQVMLTANTKPGGSQAAVIAKLNEFAKAENMDSSYRTFLAGRSKELGRTATYFLLAIVLSFVFMYMILAAQFESFIHPITILLTTPIALVAGMTPLTLSSGPGSGTNRSIGVLVVGGQSLCLLLTLLAVPVFYSLFDDLARSRVWSRVNAVTASVFGRVRRRAATAAASLL